MDELSKFYSLKELHRKALKVAERISEDEKKLIKEIVESSPNSIMYLGYIPMHIKYRSKPINNRVYKIQ